MLESTERRQVDGSLSHLSVGRVHQIRNADSSTLWCAVDELSNFGVTLALDGPLQVLTRILLRYRGKKPHPPVKELVHTMLESLSISICMYAGLMMVGVRWSECIAKWGFPRYRESVRQRFRRNIRMKKRSL